MLSIPHTCTVHITHAEVPLFCHGERERERERERRQMGSAHRSVGPLLPAVFPRPAPELRVPGGLDVDRVDDVEELLHHGHLLVDEVDLAVEGLLEE